MEQKTLGIRNLSAKEKTTRNSVPWNKKKKQTFRIFVPKHFAEENMLSSLFARIGNFCFESLSQNEPTENFKNSVRKDDF
jgi:hypothetical protein